MKRFHFVHGFWALPSGLFVVILGKIFRVKSAVSILGGDAVSLPEIEYGQLRNWLPRKLVFLTLNHATVMISLTQYLVDKLSELGFRRGNVRVIPWGIDTALFRYQEKSIGAPIRFLHIGNLNAVKDQSTLLRAFQKISENVDCHLTIVGEGPLEEEVKALAFSLKMEKNVVFEKPMPYENLPAVYQRAHILLHTSLSEGQCEVVTEAMSAGVVVCGTRVGLMYDLPQACITVAPRDHEALAKQVLALIFDSKKIDDMKNVARGWSSHHSILWTVNEIAEIYND
jgi:glycosyltransferase involved in cell wall biosynthesis